MNASLHLGQRRGPFDTEERQRFAESLRAFVRDKLKPHVDAWDEAGEIPWRIHEEAAALGIYGFGIEECYGGLGFDDCFMRMRVVEELAQCGANGVTASLGARYIGIAPIHQLGSETLKQRALPEIISGAKGACLAVTEPSGGSDVASLQTRAVRDGDDYVIDGVKTFISGGMFGHYFVVGARTGGEGLGGISLFLVEAGAPGFTRTRITRKMGWWCSDTATLYFDQCRVPAENLLGAEGRGFLAIMHTFNLERLGLAAHALGSSKLCLEEAVNYAKERVTFGRPLIERQAIRHKLVDLSMRIDALEAQIALLCWMVNAGDNPVAAIAKCKLFATETFERVASEAVQVFGGAGYLRGAVVERMYRETKVLTIGGGSAEILRDLAARQMGL